MISLNSPGTVSCRPAPTVPSKILERESGPERPTSPPSPLSPPLPRDLQRFVSSFLSTADQTSLSQVSKTWSAGLSTRRVLELEKFRFSLAQDYRMFLMLDHLLRLRHYRLPARSEVELCGTPKSDYFKGLSQDCIKLYLFLRKYPERVNEQDENGFTLLHHAASAGWALGIQLASLIYQLLSDAPGINFNIKNKDGDTAVHVAGLPSSCPHTLPDFVRHAARHGFDFRTRGNGGFTIIHLAAMNRYYIVDRESNMCSILKILTDYSEPNLRETLDALSDSGSTALYCTATNLAYCDTVALLSAGADPMRASLAENVPATHLAKLKEEASQKLQKFDPALDQIEIFRANRLIGKITEIEQLLKGEHVFIDDSLGI